MDSVVRGGLLNRGDRMPEQGIMVKAAGSSSTRGQFASNRGQPAAKNSKEREFLTNFRHEVNGSLPGEISCTVLKYLAELKSSEWQAMEFTFLEGFVPPIAYKLLVTKFSSNIFSRP